MVTDLTGTSWKLHTDALSSPPDWLNLNNITGTVMPRIGNNTFDTVDIEQTIDGIGAQLLVYRQTGTQRLLGRWVYDQGTMNYMYGATADDVITFTGGMDVTNTDLIAWFTENAEMQIPPTTYTITTTGTNVAFTGDTEITEGETATVYITPVDGYVSPYPISITGADYVYNRIHNRVTLSNPIENIIIVANATERISEYMKKGGYQILDLKEVNLTLGTESEIEGTTDALANSNNKVILVSGLVIGSTPIGDFFTQFTETSGVYTSVATVGDTVLTIVVDNDGVTVTDDSENS